MLSLLSDGWFYISAGGLLVSGYLFVYLLGQYRAAVEAEDEAVEDLPPQPDGQIAPEPIIPHSAEESPMPVIEQLSSLSPALTDSPAGVGLTESCLQDVKAQMERLDLDIVNLKDCVARQAEQNERILERLAELARKIPQQSQALKVRAPKPVPVSAPAAVPEPVAAPESVVVSEPVVEPPPAQLVLAVEPVKAEMAVEKIPEPELVSVSAPDPAFAHEPELAAVEPPQPARKGPVWPI